MGAEFLTAPAATAVVAQESVALQIYHSLAEVPARVQVQLGDSRFPQNPLHRKDIPAMGVSPLIIRGWFRPYQSWAARNAPLGCVVYDTVTEQHILLARGHKDALKGVKVLANGDVSNADFDYSGVDVVGIAPKKPISEEDGHLPVTDVSPADMYGFIYWLNEQLIEERQAGRIPAGALFMAPSGDELESLMRGLEGNYEFGRANGESPDLKVRSYKNIEAALRADTSPGWGIKNLCGVLLQMARNRFPGSRTVQASGGSWFDVAKDYFHVAYRGDCSLGSHNGFRGFRLVLSRTQ